MSLFSYSPIDRDALARPDLSRVEKNLQSADSRMLIWYQGKLITRENQALYFLYSELSESKEFLSEPVYLGRHQQLFYFACQLTDWHSQFDGYDLLTLRKASLMISDYHLGLLYHSHGILNWHGSHSFCANCGSRTRFTQAGHGRQCTKPECAKDHYPRIDPAVIFSVINNTGPESKILLARKSVWDKTRHSVIAGFVEPGENLEDTVKREACEETGLKVSNVRYVGSQPWPFPGQIMLGLSSETDQWAIKLIDQELESADWFSASDIESKCHAGLLKMPFSASISWLLIDRWFIQQKGFSLTELNQ